MFRITQHGNVYATSTNGRPIADGGTNAGVAIYEDKTVTAGDGDQRGNFKVGLVIRGKNHIGVTTNNTGDGNMYVGIDATFTVVLNWNSGRTYELKFLKGLLVGYKVP